MLPLFLASNLFLGAIIIWWRFFIYIRSAVTMLAGIKTKTFIMTSKITIEIDFDTAVPYIRVLHDRNSDDVRDKMVSQFRQKLGGTSSWCRVRFDDTGISGSPMFTIEPVQPRELPNEITMIQERIKDRDLI